MVNPTPPKITEPTAPGLYLLDGQKVRVAMAYSRQALMIIEGPNSGLSIGLVKGEWTGPVGDDHA